MQRRSSSGHDPVAPRLRRWLTDGLPVQFVRPEAFEQNAYLVVIEHALRLLR